MFMPISEMIGIFTGFIIFIICGVLFLIKSIKVDDASQKRFFLGFFGFFILWGTMKVIFYVADYYLLILSDLFTFALYWKIAASLGIAGLLLIIVNLEAFVIKNTKYVFSIIGLGGLILAIALPIVGNEITWGRLATYIMLPIAVCSIIGLYAHSYINLDGSMKHETGTILFGFALMCIGYVFTTELANSLIPYVMGTVGSITMIIGGLIFTLMYYRREL